MCRFVFLNLFFMSFSVTGIFKKTLATWLFNLIPFSRGLLVLIGITTVMSVSLEVESYFITYRRSAPANIALTTSLMLPLKAFPMIFNSSTVQGLIQLIAFPMWRCLLRKMFFLSGCMKRI